MPILSHLHQLFDVDTCAAHIPPNYVVEHLRHSSKAA
jgi:hypothetical protein